MDRSIPARAGEPNSSPIRSSQRRVYPRACGGTAESIAVALGGMGLSPRVRGNHLRRHLRRQRLGSIPRACGGTELLADQVLPAQGLSPRVRGNQDGQQGNDHKDGSIPARAGEPSGRTLLPAGRRVYPRACGGTVGVLAPVTVDYGLSPRVRGNPQIRDHLPELPGSIPARAGEPTTSPSSSARRTVYPRACGGTAIDGSAVDAVSGLSPRVRGNRRTAVTAQRGHGSIPARAGEPMRPDCAAESHAVYPCACGGTGGKHQGDVFLQGLSPRVRGNLAFQAMDGVAQRSIPARAGEPVRAPRTRATRTVYPRACGGTTPAEPVPQLRYGLSPRVRGNRHDEPALFPPVGSIPARAGEPAPARACRCTGWVYPRACGGTNSKGSPHSER